MEETSKDDSAPPGGWDWWLRGLHMEVTALKKDWKKQTEIWGKFNSETPKTSHQAHHYRDPHLLFCHRVVIHIYIIYMLDPNRFSKALKSTPGWHSIWSLNRMSSLNRRIGKYLTPLRSQGDKRCDGSRSDWIEVQEHPWPHSSATKSRTTLEADRKTAEEEENQTLNSCKRQPQEPDHQQVAHQRKHGAEMGLTWGPV